MNTLSEDRQAQVISALVEGNSIRSVERMAGIHRDTIMRLAVRVADGCDSLMDEMMRCLTCPRLQLDEICIIRANLKLGHYSVSPLSGADVAGGLE